MSIKNKQDLNLQLEDIQQQDQDGNQQESQEKSPCESCRQPLDGNNKCLCQICTCGLHKCPPQYKSGQPLFETESYYRECYRPFTANQAKNTSQNEIYSQKNQWINNKKIQQSQIDFAHPNPGEQFKTVKQLENEKLFQSSCQNQAKTQNYLNAKQRKINELKCNPLPQGEFEGVSSNQLQYGAKVLDSTKSCKPIITTQLWVPEQVEYESTYQRNTKNSSANKVTQTQTKKNFNESNNILSDYLGQPFTAQTTNQIVYQQKEREQFQRSEKGYLFYHSPVPYAKDQLEVDYDTEYTKDFQQKELKKCPITNIKKIPQYCTPGKDHCYFNKQKKYWE